MKGGMDLVCKIKCVTNMRGLLRDKILSLNVIAFHSLLKQISNIRISWDLLQRQQIGEFEVDEP